MVLIRNDPIEKSKILAFPNSFSKLLLPSFFLDISRIDSDYLTVRRNGIKIGCDFYDVVLGSEEAKSLPSDYLMPIHNMLNSIGKPQQYDCEAFNFAGAQFRESNFRRVYLKSSPGENDSLVEISSLNPVKPTYSTIYEIDNLALFNHDLKTENGLIRLLNG